jgi:hypothetical protein
MEDLFVAWSETFSVNAPKSSSQMPSKSESLSDYGKSNFFSINQDG